MIYSTSVFVTDELGLTYEQWRTQSGFFTPAEQADPAISGPDADPDGDGIQNLLEFAMATHPRENSAAFLPHLRSGPGGEVIFAWRQSSTSAGTFTPQTSEDLAVWQDAIVPPVPAAVTPAYVEYEIVLPPRDRQSVRMWFR